jgi:hypothetical protein
MIGLWDGFGIGGAGERRDYGDTEARRGKGREEKISMVLLEI